MSPAFPRKTNLASSKNQAVVTFSRRPCPTCSPSHGQTGNYAHRTLAGQKSASRRSPPSPFLANFRFVDERSDHGLRHDVLQMSLQLISDRYYNRRDSRLWLVCWTGFKGSTPLRTITYLCYLSACFNVFGPFWFHGWFFTPACSMPSGSF
jgi:hypothetical protein